MVPQGSLAFYFTANSQNGPLILLARADGAYIEANGTIVAENGDCIDSGQFVTAGNNRYYSYCPIVDLSGWPAGIKAGFKGPRGNYSDSYYFSGVQSILGDLHVFIQRIKDDFTLVKTADCGVIIGAFGFPVSGFACVAPNNDNTIVYFNISGGNGGTSLQRRTVGAWDFVNDVFLPDLAVEADRVVCGPHGILVLRDDTILVAWSGEDITTTVVKRYQADGTVLNTYTLVNTPSHDAVMIEPDFEGSDTFWVSFYGDADYCFIQQIQVSDGAILTNIEITQAFVDSINALLVGTYPDIDFQPDLGFFLTRSQCGVVENEMSGIYILTRSDRHDTVYRKDPAEQKIPNPFVITAFLED